MLHHGLKTNFRRRRCGFTKDSSCSFCHLQSEDELHILRDCPFASQVWYAIVGHNLESSFFNMNMYDWFSKNPNPLRSVHVHSLNWHLVFGFTIWMLWKNRNARIYQNEISSVISLSSNSKPYC